MNSSGSNSNLNSNYLAMHHRQHDTRQHTSQAAHDKAFLRTLLVLVGICLLCTLFAKAQSGAGAGVAKPTPRPAAAPATAVDVPVATPAPSYVPTPDQSKDLKIAQLEAVNSQIMWTTASLKLPEYAAWQEAARKIPEYKALAEAVQNIQNLCLKVAADNKWPKDVVCNMDQRPITFAQGTAPVAAPVAPAK